MQDQGISIWIQRNLLDGISSTRMSRRLIHWTYEALNRWRSFTSLAKTWIMKYRIEKGKKVFFLSILKMIYKDNNKDDTTGSKLIVIYPVAITQRGAKMFIQTYPWSGAFLLLMIGFLDIALESRGKVWSGNLISVSMAEWAFIAASNDS